MHGDVSYNNIMVLTDGLHNEPRFILCDLDSAVTRTIEDKTLNYRTRSLPFVSNEILHDLWYMHEMDDIPSVSVPLVPPRHHLRFDFESLLYVALWCCFKCEKPPNSKIKKRVETEVNEWECGSYDSLFNRKTYLLTRITGPNSLQFVPMTPLFEPWRPWLAAWIEAVFPAAALLQRYGYEVNPTDTVSLHLAPLDRETLGGYWTRHTILTALHEAEPSPLPQ